MKIGGLSWGCSLKMCQSQSFKSKCECDVEHRSCSKQKKMMCACSKKDDVWLLCSKNWLISSVSFSFAPNEDL